MSMKITVADRPEPRMADKILAEIENLGTGHGKIAEYENGREHGWVLTDQASNRSVTFAENRNSDDAVVYIVDWNNCSEAAREEAYKARHFSVTTTSAGPRSSL